MSPSTDEALARDERMALAVYERSVRAVIGPGTAAKFVAIAVESGDFEIDPDDNAALTRLHARHLGARVWLMRVGPRAAYRMAGAGREASA